MSARHRLILGVLALTSVVPLGGCARGCTSSRPPIHINPSMDDQPKVPPPTASRFFYDGQSMRQPVPGTVPIGGLKEDTAFFTGKGADGRLVGTIPVTVDAALLERLQAKDSEGGSADGLPRTGPETVRMHGVPTSSAVSLSEDQMVTRPRRFRSTR